MVCLQSPTEILCATALLILITIVSSFYVTITKIRVEASACFISAALLGYLTPQLQALIIIITGGKEPSLF